MYSNIHAARLFLKDTLEGRWNQNRSLVHMAQMISQTSPLLMTLDGEPTVGPWGRGPGSVTLLLLLLLLLLIQLFAGVGHHHYPRFA